MSEESPMILLLGMWFAFDPIASEIGVGSNLLIPGHVCSVNLLPFGELDLYKRVCW